VAGADGLGLPQGEIDISAPSPIRWMSSRNKVPATLPIWLDPMARAYYRVAKSIDQHALQFKRWRRTRFDGMTRCLNEHYTVYLQRRGGVEAPVAVRAPAGSYYADPFLCVEDGRHWLFVEEFRYRECRGRICALPIDAALRTGTPRPVLPLACHASFPFVFRHDGRLYLLPETGAQRSIDLYECVAFPDQWRLRRRLLYDIDPADSVLVRHDDYWWLITSERRSNQHGRHLAIYFCRDLLNDPWQPHPINAECRYETEAFQSYRNAGALDGEAGGLLRLAQASRRYYGEGLQLMRIEALTTAAFAETPLLDAHPLAALIARDSPHHLSSAGDLVAWDVRDRRRWRDLMPWRRARPDVTSDRRLPPVESTAARAESAEIP
jgi:hypothetical protein